MTPLMTILGWLAAGAMAVGDRMLRAVGVRGRDEKEVAGQLGGPATSTGVIGLADQVAEPATCRVLVGVRLDAGTELALDRDGWPPWVTDAQPGPAKIGNWQVVIERSDRGAVVVRAPGQMRLEIGESVATVTMGRRAVDTLGGFEGWLQAWLPSIHSWLTGSEIATIGELEAAGWRVTAPDLASDIAGLVLRIEDADAKRWTSAASPIPREIVDGEVRWLGLGAEGDPLWASLYRKDKHRMADGAGRALRERWRQAGWDGREPVTRAEGRPRGEALRLRARGDTGGEVVVDLSRLSDCCDQTKLARFWAYMFGRPGDRSGHWRLVIPAKTAAGADRPARKCEVDPRWRVVQAAAGEVPVETLAQVSARRQAARDDWHARAREAVVRGLAEDVALDGVEDADAARGVALERAGEWLRGAGWRPAWGRARAATQDLLEQAKGAGE